MFRSYKKPFHYSPIKIFVNNKFLYFLKYYQLIDKIIYYTYMSSLYFFKKQKPNTHTKTSIVFIGETRTMLNQNTQLSSFDTELNINLSTNIAIDFIAEYKDQHQYWPIYCYLKNQNPQFSSTHETLYLGAHWPETALQNHLHQHKTTHLLLGIRDINPNLVSKTNYISDRDLFLFQYNLQEQLNNLSDNIHLVIHLNFFASYLFPNAQPKLEGGPLWWQSLLLIKDIFRLKNITQATLLGFCEDCKKSQENLAQLLKKLVAYQSVFNQNETELPLFSNN